MELIPILSLIILVATISTFILAVGAYILYKVRERKGKTSAAEQPSAIEAELVTPTRVVADTRRTAATGEQIYTRGTRGESRYTSERLTEPQMRPTFVAPKETRTTRTNATRYSVPVTRETFDSERYTSVQKFKRYTRPVQNENKEKKEESLKWR